MDTDTHGLEADLTEAVIGSAFEISKVLGAGFLEKVYERAMIRELARTPRRRGEFRIGGPAAGGRRARGVRRCDGRPEEIARPSESVCIRVHPWPKFAANG